MRLIIINSHTNVYYILIFQYIYYDIVIVIICNVYFHGHAYTPSPSQHFLTYTTHTDRVLPPKSYYKTETGRGKYNTTSPQHQPDSHLPVWSVRRVGVV